MGDHPAAAPSATAPPTARGRRRREAVLDAAAELFLEHGFHGTSIDDVGAAAGISGPGVYRHVPSKDALLMAVLDRLWDQLRPAIAEVAQLPADEAVERLLDAHFELAIGQPAALVLLVRELRHLPDDYRRLAARNHRRYVDAWVDALCRRAPGLSDDDARGTALAVHGLIDSVALNPQARVGARRRELLRDLADAVIERGTAQGELRAPRSAGR